MMIIDNLNEILENNDIMCRIGSDWYRLEEIHMNDNKMPIFVSDEDGEDYEFDITDVDEFDPMFEIFREMDWHNVGVA